MPDSVPQQVQQQVSEIWEADLALQFMLLFLLVMVFGLLPLSGLEPIQGRGDQVAAAGFSLLGISGVFAVTRTRGARILGLVAMTAPIGLGWYNALAPRTTTALLRSTLVLVALLWMAFLTLRHVFRSGPITRARLQGAIAVYLLLAIAFGEAYWIVLQLLPDAFRFPPDSAGAGKEKSSLIYFSMTTLTTLGYGDILPLRPVARSLATLEGLIGQLYPAVLIGRLVSLQSTTAQKVDRKAEHQ